MKKYACTIDQEPVYIGSMKECLKRIMKSVHATQITITEIEDYI